MSNNPFLTRVLIFCGVFTAFFVSAVVLASFVTYEPWGVPEVKRKEYKQAVTLLEQRIEAAKTADPSLKPKIVIAQDSHDFGYMDPLTMGSHAFMITNDGDADLTLTGGETTCKCTLVKGEKQIIAPGASSQVTLTWNSGRKREYYEQQALIRTNDPSEPEIRLKIHGKVRAEIGFSMDELNFGNIDPGGQRSLSFNVYSQLYHDFEIEKIEATTDGIVWELNPLEEEELSKHEARSGYLVAAKLSTSQSDKYISGMLRFHILKPDQTFNEAETPIDETPLDSLVDVPQPETDEHPDGLSGDMIVREIPFRGRIVSSLSLIGADLVRDGGLQMGIMNSNKQHEKRLFLKVRGNKQPEHLRIGKVEPAFIDAALTQSSSNKNMYTLVIKVPEGAPMTIFNTPQSRGQLEIESDLAVSGKLVLPLIGAVVD